MSVPPAPAGRPITESPAGASSVAPPANTPTGPAVTGSRMGPRRPGQNRSLVAALLAALVAALLAWPATAQPALRPGIGEVDPRRPVNPEESPWHALGRVQLEVGGRCTGALIGPRLMLTAAHCLVAPRSRALVQPGTIHVLLGYVRGTARGHARATAYRIGPGFDPSKGGPAAADWAILSLDTPLGTPDRILPLLAAPPAPRAPLMLGGYQQDRPEVIIADTGCRLLGLSAGGPGAMLLHDCAGTRGSSGAPLLARGPEGSWAIAGIASRVAASAALGAAVPASAIRP
ncbi:trypsin-like serine protease [Belnapia sp. T18]|uniref:Serine protease n=1 Tax=Belnapia arida TaxID=2804533 RepID=A0ABS1TYF0_9PROT|nr:trypsin-like serine protease [Belnapia arida]MBL6076447.1 trypsin-like serine protease [Belnapia arida]